MSVIVPLSLPGVLSATIIALSLSMGSFIAPHYLGGPSDLTLTTLVAQFVLATYNGELAAAVAVLLLVAMALAILALIGRRVPLGPRMTRAVHIAGRAYLALVMVFLLGPAGSCWSRIRSMPPAASPARSRG